MFREFPDGLNCLMILEERKKKTEGRGENYKPSELSVMLNFRKRHWVIN